MIHLIKTFSTLNIRLPKIGVPITTTTTRYGMVWYGMFVGWLNANEVHGHNMMKSMRIRL